MGHSPFRGFQNKQLSLQPYFQYFQVYVNKLGPTFTAVLFVKKYIRSIAFVKLHLVESDVFASGLFSSFRSFTLKPGLFVRFEPWTGESKLSF